MTDESIGSKIKQLVQAGEFKISEHGLDALLDDGLGRVDVIDSIADAEVLENYPEFGKGPAVLLYQISSEGFAVHTVWGIPKGFDSPAVLITAYFPDPTRWEDNMKTRK